MFTTKARRCGERGNPEIFETQRNGRSGGEQIFAPKPREIRHRKTAWWDMHSGGLERSDRTTDISRGISPAGQQALGSSVRFLRGSPEAEFPARSSIPGPYFLRSELSFARGCFPARRQGLFRFLWE